MNSILYLLVALLAGFALGGFYFGSLWITVRQLPTTQWPFRLFVGSYLGRIVITVLGFYIVTDGHWERTLACLAGFLVARSVCVRLWGPQQLPSKLPTQK